MFDDEVITGDTPVPFGKYKGQPCSVLLADAGYREWVLTQAGITEKYPAIIAFLCEGEQHSSTPAHNALQARLMDPKFMAAFGSLLIDEPTGGWYAAQFEYNGFDAAVLNEHRSIFMVECKPSLSDDYPAVMRQMQTADQVAYAKNHGKGSPYSPVHGNWRMVLLAGSFKSSAITLEQAKRFFKLSRITLITVDEVELADLV